MTQKAMKEAFELLNEAAAGRRQITRQEAAYLRELLADRDEVARHSRARLDALDIALGRAPIPKDMRFPTG